MRRNFPDPQIIRYTLTRLAASDPGLSRLKFASRVTLSVMSAVLVMAVIATLVDAKMTVAILAGILGVMSNVLVNDDTEDEQKVTTGLLILSSAVSVTAATSLSLVGDHLPDLAILSVVFLIFLFATVRDSLFFLGDGQLYLFLFFIVITCPIWAIALDLCGDSGGRVGCLLLSLHFI